jgi:hypothetical protein
MSAFRRRATLGVEGSVGKVLLRGIFLVGRVGIEPTTP